jgi:Na+-dependent transporters of the SNF family
VSDLLFAIIAGFAVMPAVFAAGIAPGAGPGLVFDTLPFIFNKMARHTRAQAPIVRHHLRSCTTPRVTRTVPYVPNVPGPYYRNVPGFRGYGYR